MLLARFFLQRIMIIKLISTLQERRARQISPQKVEYKQLDFILKKNALVAYYLIVKFSEFGKIANNSTR